MAKKKPAKKATRKKAPAAKKAAPKKKAPAKKPVPAAPPPPEVLAQGVLSVNPTGQAVFACERLSPSAVRLTVRPRGVTQVVRRLALLVDVGSLVAKSAARVGEATWTPKREGSQALLQFAPPWPGDGVLVMDLEAEGEIKAVSVRGL